MMVNQLAKNIQLLRKKHKLSQQALGAQLGLTRSNIASYENGKAEPRAANLVRIAKYFQIDLSHLIEVDLQFLSEEELLKIGMEQNSNTLSTKQQQTIDDFLVKSENVNKVLTGFQEFYKFKLETLRTSPDNVQSVIYDFENLLSVMESLRQINQELIDFIKKAQKK